MKKLYALISGVLLTLIALARPGTPDVANFTYVISQPGNNVAFTNTSILGNEPGERRAFWSFGDGTGAITPPLQGTQHHYQSSGTYTVCLKIYRYRPNINDSVLTAQVCKTVTIASDCGANFERIPSGSNNPLQVSFRALLQHNANRKPQKICWTFGDNKDTCINYPENYTGQYTVSHLYAHAGQYQVCVRIIYYGGCEASKCEHITVVNPDTCSANFERIPSTTNDPLRANFRALPQHSNNRKPSRICWTFGDGRDTCINYPENYTGQYTVSHLYAHAGQYQVCVRIIYYGGCEASKCEHITVVNPDTCSANFERIPSTTNDPLRANFRALPQHSNNRKPSRICWTFGDGRDTCINYPENYTGQYTVSHLYEHPGQYEVCVKILYYGGCEARKCEHITVVGNPVSCSANFERIPSGTDNPLLAKFRALPQHSANRKPARICWTFGDGRDTCINYPENYTGQYIVSHLYQHPGQYEVCVKTLYYGGCEARKCEQITVGTTGLCHANFERIPSTTNNPLQAKFRALPQHSTNRKPARICWTFGDGTSTCINYLENFTGQYVVVHNYDHPGQYEVCVNILYYGGCEARKCNPVTIIGNTQPVLHLSPNPVINEIHVNFLSTHTEQVTIKILNSMGNPVRNYVRNVVAGPNNWGHDLVGLLPGLYTYIIQSPNQLVSATFLKL